ncbi:tannase/feruloyl esterase family alpha/beta hydrolase [Micromonospora sp. WMMD1128]|uniref:tannase/feruloyl esterase family alpha/beta hydrolase n=1 Tax=Micromonospora sp. WMMD1128 TaxID=3015150 RepID=UPI00248B42FD|nr:tannase/feruloyl esterase family alpha/beta hydrolase [Micromonospora sp. WMMD1128]WBB75891.1 tannase/feruloyl esterase family alpha/beta hydrolase [Micromonospora sp. WMMD1128]
MLHRLRLRTGLAVVAGLVVAGSPGPALAHGKPNPRPDCSAVAAGKLSRAVGQPTTVTSATTGATAAGTSYCDVRAGITVRAHDRSTSVVQLRLQVPTDWNRRYVQLGGGGFCGSIPTAGTSGDGTVDLGYAVASDDTGHVGGGSDASFAYDDTAAQNTWGYLSEHLTALAAKAILKAVTRQTTAYAYFVGCSTGGRQALIEAQRWPGDFDGIVAGAPANRQNYLAPLSQGTRELQNRDADFRQIVDASAAAVLARGVLAACDGVVRDGVVDDPRTCRFDPATLLCPGGTAAPDCLSAAQVAVARKWYDSPRDERGRELYPGGLPLGSEGGWVGADISTSPTGLSGGGAYAEQVLRYLAFPTDPGPTYSLRDFDPSRDAARLAAMAKVYNADTTNLDAFRRAGGKLMLYHGLADPLITPFGTIQYYEDVVRRYGSLARTQQFARLYLLPGVYHCAGGPGPDRVDWLGAIRAWTERGRAPASVLAGKVSGGVTTMERPVYAYPLRARYDGSGDPNAAANWRPAPGPRGRR